MDNEKNHISYGKTNVFINMETCLETKRASLDERGVTRPSSDGRGAKEGAASEEVSLKNILNSQVCYSFYLSNYLSKIIYKAIYLVFIYLCLPYLCLYLCLY